VAPFLRHGVYIHHFDHNNQQETQLLLCIMSVEILRNAAQFHTTGQSNFT